MKQWHMTIDVAKCEDCNNCLLACKDEHVENDWPGYSAPQPRHGHRWMNVARKERGQFPLIDVAYRPTPCMHCSDPACGKSSGDAISKRSDGIVLLPPGKAKGKRDMVGSCPYGAIFWNEELQIVQKCTFCAHLIDKRWKQPRCVQACPTGALRSVLVEPSEMAHMVERENLSVLHPELNTRPRVYYANLYRFDSCFIAGTAVVETDGIDDCLTGANVVLKQGDKVLAETQTDAFGDFKFDRLAHSEGSYVVEIEATGLGRVGIPVQKLTSSTNIGAVRFPRSQVPIGSAAKA